MRRVTRVMILGAAIIGGFALLPDGPAEAAPKAEYGFALADQPTNPSYPANPRASANSAGAVNTVVRHEPGNYTVRMPGLGAANGGNVQVSAYGENSNRCKPSTWHATGVAMEIGVVCQNRFGSRADSPFTVQFHRGSNNLSHQSAYLLMGEASTTPDPVFSFNSTGGVNRVTKLATGRWRVDLPGFTRLGGVVHVSGVGWDGDFCKVQAWGTASAEVRCYTAAGQLTNSSWSLRYHDQHLPNGFAELGGYVWAEKSGAALGVPYVPHLTHNFNMNVLPNQVTHLSTGRYDVRLPRTPAFDAGNPVVTAHGTGAVTCKVTELRSSGSTASVSVDCRSATGVLQDSRFTLTHVTNR